MLTAWNPPWWVCWYHRNWQMLLGMAPPSQTSNLPGHHWNVFWYNDVPIRACLMGPKRLRIHLPSVSAPTSHSLRESQVILFLSNLQIPSLCGSVSPMSMPVWNKTTIWNVAKGNSEPVHYFQIILPCMKYIDAAITGNRDGASRSSRLWAILNYSAPLFLCGTDRPCSTD